MSLSGRHALVCGASAGIGRAAALALARLGASVSVLARSEDKLLALVPRLLNAGASSARHRVVDMEDRPALRAAVEGVISEAGPVHVLINNSGGPPSGPILQADEEDFLRPFGRHVLAFHLLVKLVLPGMHAAGYGRIVNIVSTSVREPIPGLGVSNTVRGAVAAWAKSVSRELPPGVTINNVLPGYTDTERLGALRLAVSRRSGKTPEQVEADWLASVPEGRLGRPDELAAAIAFLVSPAASFIRGVSLPVDGGRLLSI
jgi:3-oxoacyl-[acyl-carrier protein] reductase